jgi:formylglycine-generating enzyme required for sulfatase activity
MSLVKEKEKAKDKIIRFAQKWGQEHLDLACHAAFPLAVTPELLYCLRENFLPQCPWIAVADLILSPLCDPVGDELYEMDGVVRDLLLKRLVTDSRFEQKRLNQLADFMGAYIESQLPTSPRADRDLGKTREWVALAYIHGENIQRLRQKLEELFRSGNSKIRQRLANFMEEEEDLLIAAGLEPLMVEVSRQWDSLETLELFEFEADIATIVFEEERLQKWEFTVPTVNRRGKIIKTETHSAQYYTEDLGNDITLDLVAIPGGEFMMGTEDEEIERLVKKFNWEEYRREKPQHKVTVQPFFMGKYPITQAQWKAIAARTDLKVNIDLDEDPSDFKKPYQDQDREIERWLRPVENVNWYEAVEFCQRLSKLTRRDYRLPSEAQWEYACRGVTEPLNPELGETYPPFHFGETITGNLANYDASYTYGDEPKGEYRRQTTPVGQFPPNAFGLSDMHGNVWEWCADDWHDNYEGAPTDGSAWIDSNEEENLEGENQLESTENNENNPYSVLRGGSWNYNPAVCRSAFRNYYDRRVFRYDFYGFRVVCVFGRTL